MLRHLFFIPTFSIHWVLCLLLASPLAHAVDAQQAQSRQSLLQVEYVLFENVRANLEVLRYEDLRFQPHDPEQPNRYLYPYSRPLSSGHLVPISKDLMLQAAITKLQKNSREYRIWSQGAWLQPISDNQTDPPVHLEINDQKNSSRWLQGSINVRKSRFYHADIDVYLSDFITLPYDNMATWLLEAEATRWPTEWLALPLPVEQDWAGQKGHSKLAVNTIHFKDSRRLKNGEIHYIDHPALGLIITVKDVTTSQDQ